MAAEMDLVLPNAVVNRMIKDSVPRYVKVSKEAGSAIAKAASVFILYASSCAKDMALKANRRTVHGNDVIAAMTDMEFDKFISLLETSLQNLKKSQQKKKESAAAKKRKKAAEKKNNSSTANGEEEDEPTSISAAENDDDDEEEEILIKNLEPDESLLDPNFEGYKFFSRVDLGDTRTKLPTKISLRRPSEDQFSFAHSKLFARTNVLVKDPKSDGGYLLSNNSISKVIPGGGGGGNGEQQREPTVIRQIWSEEKSFRPWTPLSTSTSTTTTTTTTTTTSSKDGIFNPSLSFTDDGGTMALYGDGRGLLYILKINGDEADWTEVFRWERGGPFLVLDSLRKDDKLEVLIIYVEERDDFFEELKDDGLDAVNVVEWLTFKESNGDETNPNNRGGYTMERLRRFVFFGSCDFMSFSSFNTFTVATDKGYQVLNDDDTFDVPPDGSYSLVTFSGEDGKLTSHFDIQGHQWLFNPDRRAFCLRHDVDGLIWTAVAKAVAAANDENGGGKVEFRHVGTFCAFGYIQASKKKRKFTVCAPDFSYAAILDRTRYVYIYKRPPSKTTNLESESDLTNGGQQQQQQQPQQQFAKQTCLRLDSAEEIVGAVATNTILIISTISEVFCIKIYDQVGQKVYSIL